jgi:hypothetical protein
MRKILLKALAISLITKYLVLTTCMAQSPQGIPYQAIARNASGVAIANTAVKVRFSIRDSIATGAIKYQETHNPTTSALGLFSVNVGMGTVVSGTFSGINWGKNAKFLQVELNTTGGTTFTDLGTTQMMSVPYALFAGQTLSNSNTSGSGFTMISNPSPTIGTNGYTLLNALDYCYKLSESGFSDWRLPSHSEVIDNLLQNGVYQIDGNARFWGWTSTKISGGTEWCYFMELTGSPSVGSSIGTNGNLKTIKCVR